MLTATVAVLAVAVILLCAALWALVSVLKHTLIAAGVLEELSDLVREKKDRAIKDLDTRPAEGEDPADFWKRRGGGF